LQPVVANVYFRCPLRHDCVNYCRHKRIGIRQVDIQEGHVYEGYVSALGGEGPLARWIVVSPFGKRHAHSIGDPLALHCMPFGILQQQVECGSLIFVASQPDHPVIRLQRVKEAHGLHDTHMGLCGEPLETMIALLQGAVAGAQDYAPYLAGEILSALDRTHHSDEQMEQIAQRVHRILSSA
jgi:hypothetical protein